MREICFCGRVGEVEDREPVILETGEQPLECPACGDMDPVDWLHGEARMGAFGAAAQKSARRIPVVALSAGSQR